MIDGLDHILREQAPDRSLLLDLPDPDQIPDGVFIVLGSQTDQPLSSRVRREVSSPDRRIETQPLSRAATLSIIAESELPCALADADADLAYQLCDGHPLALAYILNQLRLLDAADSVAETLQRIERFDDTIETQYESYWDEIADQPALRVLFGLLSRMRGAIELKWVRTWADSEAVNALQRTARHYFRREADCWYFFHNSFRMFLRTKTQEECPGEPSPDVDRRLYRTLAEHCDATPVDSPNSWDALHYRCLAHDHEVAVRLATPAYFRNQFLAFRPLHAIREDIDATLLVSAEVRDTVAFVRILLAAAEFQQREYHLEDVSLGLLLLDHEKHEQALAHIREGRHLRVGARSALECARGLLGRGMQEEARQVFDLAEPLRFLSGAAALEDLAGGDNADYLYAWAEVAPFFLGVDEILETIDRVQVETVSTWNMSADEATRFVRRRMHSHVGDGLTDKQDWDALDRVLDGFDLRDAVDLSDWCWLVIRVLMNRAQVGDVVKARAYLGRLLDVVDPETRDAEERVLVAEWVFRLLRDFEETKRWLAGLNQPEIPQEVYSQSGFGPFELRFRLNRLLYALGSNARVTTLVPDSDDPKNELTVLFERAVCKIAWIWGRSWRGQTMTSFEVESEARSLLRFLNRDSREQEDRLRFWALRDLRKDLFTLLIRAVACHGPESVAALRDAMEREWDDPSTEGFWPPDLIRELTLVMQFHGVEVGRAAQRLRTIEPLMTGGTDTSGRVGQYRAQAEAWRELDCQADADRCLRSMLQASLGVGYRKDYQLDSWINWLGRIIDAEPARAPEGIGWFASAIQALEQQAEGRAAGSASRALLRVAFRWSPRRAVRLFAWLGSQGLIWYADGLHDLLAAALEVDPAPTNTILPVYNHLYHTISLGGATDIAAQVVRKIAAQAGGADTVRVAANMLASMERYGLSSNRISMRYEIATALQNAGVSLSSCGLSDADLLEPEAERPYGSRLQLDDRELTVEDVLEQARGVDEVEVLLGREANTSHFDWAPVVREVAAGLTIADLGRLAALFSNRHRAVDVLCAIADQMHATGTNEHLAWQVGHRALDSSEAYGWDPYSDGGSRIKAFATLVNIRPAEGRELAYRRLAQDIAEDFRYPATIVLHLDRILPLVADEVPLRDVWAEIESHVHELFKDVYSTPGLTDLLTTAPENDTAESAVADLIAIHLDHPAWAIAQAAQRALGTCLSDAHDAVDRVVMEALEGGEPRQESVLMVLDAMSLTHTSIVSQFADQIQRLTSSPSICVRQAAEAICSRLDVSASSSQCRTTALAPVYELALPEQRAIYVPSPQELPGHKPLPDSDVPREMLRPFNQNLKTVAELVGLDPENCYYRASQIMQELEPRISWCAQAESRLRSMMNSTGLEFSFRRPRSVVARRAMFHVVGELLDAGRLSRGQLLLLDFVLRTYDPAMVLLEPAPRPAAIVPIRVSNEYQVGRPEWIETVADAFESCACPRVDERFLVAEGTIIKCLEISHPIEHRQSLVFDGTIAQPASGDEGQGFFHEVKQHWASEYPSLGARGSPIPIVIRHVGIGYDSPGDSWLAINPAVGEQLGWSPSDEGLFAWVDDNGDVMAESLWWIDGVIAQYRTTASRDEVGEGWLVLASSEGWNQLCGLSSSLTRRQRVERQYRPDGRVAPTKTSIREMPI